MNNVHRTYVLKLARIYQPIIKCGGKSIALNFHRTKLYLVYSSTDEVFLPRGNALCSSNLKNIDF